jgi:hypothetical protein
MATAETAPRRRGIPTRAMVALAPLVAPTATVVRDLLAVPMAMAARGLLARQVVARRVPQAAAVAPVALAAADPAVALVAAPVAMAAQAALVADRVAYLARAAAVAQAAAVDAGVVAHAAVPTQVAHVAPPQRRRASLAPSPCPRPCW